MTVDVASSLSMPETEGNSVAAYAVVVIGGGQSGLAIGYYLRRTNLQFIILDAEQGPGGAWRHGWDSLRLFSPAAYSSLPGWLMPGAGHLDGPNPSRDAVLDYLSAYEARYQLPIQRPVLVQSVRRAGDRLVIETDRGGYSAHAVVSATGTWRRPYVPQYPGQEHFHGMQLHAVDYQRPDQFAGKRVLIVGGGNSAAQILAEVSFVADTTWVTLDPPAFLPDDVDGRVLFERATARFKAQKQGVPYDEPLGGLGNIVMVPPVKQARARGVLRAVRPFHSFTERGVIWPDGQETEVDTVMWCTGFRAVLDHLAPLGVINDDGQIETVGTRSITQPQLWLVGYGDWTGIASATLIGVGRSARTTVADIEHALTMADESIP